MSLVNPDHPDKCNCLSCAIQAMNEKTPVEATKSDETTKSDAERIEVLNKIEEFKEKLPPESEIEKLLFLDMVCNLSADESRVGTQSNKKNLKFFWSRIGGDYFTIWKQSVHLQCVASHVVTGTYNKIIEMFLEPNNGWH